MSSLWAAVPLLCAREEAVPGLESPGLRPTSEYTQGCPPSSPYLEPPPPASSTPILAMAIRHLPP